MISAFRNTLAGLVVAAAFAPSAMAQDTKNQGYLVDVNGNVVTSSTTGLCVRTSDWTPARAAAAAACNMRPTCARNRTRSQACAETETRSEARAETEAGEAKPKPKPQFRTSSSRSSCKASRSTRPN